MQPNEHAVGLSEPAMVPEQFNAEVQRIRRRTDQVFRVLVWWCLGIAGLLLVRLLGG